MTCDDSWMEEKATLAVVEICQALEWLPRWSSFARTSAHPIEEPTQQAVASLGAALYDATKVVCELISRRTGQPMQWTPELRDRLFEHPESCRDELRALGTHVLPDEPKDGQ